MNLSEADLRLLHLIELDPTVSVRELAKKAGISWITARRHITELRQSRVLSDPVAVFNPNSLGLERHVVFLKARTEAQLRALELACDTHPYTHYRTRIYGPFTGLFVQFDIPSEGQRNLERYLTALEEERLSEGAIRRKSTGHRCSTSTNPELFDPRTLSWRYEWSQWDREIDTMPDSLPPLPRKISLGDLRLTNVDLQILRELTNNANVSQKTLEDRFSMSQSSVSRRIIFIRENFIESVRAQIDRSQFDIRSTKLFFASISEETDRSRLYNALHAASAPPFPISIDLLERGMVVLWGRLPPSHEHNLFYVLWKRLPTLQVFTMDTIREHSRMYWFYPENAELERGCWRSDEQWMVEIPLTTLKNAIQRGADPVRYL